MNSTTIHFPLGAHGGHCGCADGRGRVLLESGERQLGNRIAQMQPTQHVEAGASHQGHAALDLFPEYLDRSCDAPLTP
jgi:hypothetical protein